MIQDQELLVTHKKTYFMSQMQGWSFTPTILIQTLAPTSIQILLSHGHVLLKGKTNVTAKEAL